MFYELGRLVSAIKDSLITLISFSSTGMDSVKDNIVKYWETFKGHHTELTEAVEKINCYYKEIRN